MLGDTSDIFKMQRVKPGYFFISFAIYLLFLKMQTSISFDIYGYFTFKTRKGSLKKSSSIKRGRGGGVKGKAIKERGTFFGTFFSSVPKFQRPLSLRGGGRRGVRP